MSIKKIISGYARYNHWANEEMTKWLKTLGDNLFYKETPSSFSSISLTVQHMIDAQTFWFAIITEADVTKLDESTKYNTTDNIINDLLAGSQQMLNKYGAYTEDELLKQLPATDMIKCRYEYILHVINHNSYHRGQIVTMSRCLGVVDNIPVTDYDVFLWLGH